MPVLPRPSTTARGRPFDLLLPLALTLVSNVFQRVDRRQSSALRAPVPHRRNPDRKDPDLHYKRGKLLRSDGPRLHCRELRICETPANGQTLRLAVGTVEPVVNGGLIQ